MFVLIKARNDELDGICEVKVFETYDEADCEMDAQVHKCLREYSNDDLLCLDWHVDEMSAYIAAGFNGFEWRIYEAR